MLWDIKGYQALRDHEVETQQEETRGTSPNGIKKDSKGKVKSKLTTSLIPGCLTVI